MLKKTCPTSQSGQREGEMKLHGLFLLCLCSALSCCSATALSDTSARQLHSFYTTTQSPVTAIDVVMPFIPVFWPGTRRCNLSPGLCLVTPGWSALPWLESPSPQYLFFASLPLSCCRWANTCFVECEREVCPRLKGSCFGFSWHGGEWCQFVWCCTWQSQLLVSLLSGFYVHSLYYFNLEFVFS